MKRNESHEQLTPRRKRLFTLIACGLVIIVAGLLLELTFRILELVEKRKESYRGAGGIWMSDPRWGWKPTPGEFAHRTAEFSAFGSVNSNFMNDFPEHPSAEAHKSRILVLGDSHTFASGVSMTQTWAKRLEFYLNEGTIGQSFRVYNAGTTGYSAHQYLLRLIDDGHRIKPHYVIVGISFATDFYDLLPPARGGWIYGGERERDYFDLDESGRLAMNHWAPSNSGAKQAGAKNTAMSARLLLGHFATFRYLRRSKLALSWGAKLKVGGQSLWPNMEIVMEKKISPSHRYQHDLFQALLHRMKEESDKLGATMIVVGIPYLPQVYDNLREAAFPGDRYDPKAASRRVSDYCRGAGIVYVDVLQPLHERYAKTGRWLHFRKDAHPNPEGHEVIARSVLEASVIKGRNL